MGAPASVQATPAFFPGTVREVELLTADRAQLTHFYCRLLGVEELARDGSTSLLGRTAGEPITGDAPALRLRVVGDRGARPRPPGSAGLFHTAFLFPDRPALAAATHRLMALAQTDPAVRVQGGSEHGISEAVYGRDPDGNGIELAFDRPFAFWPRHANGDLAIFSRPLDLSELLQHPLPAGAAVVPTFGHIHLGVGSLARAEAFFAGEMGFGVVQRSYPGALFLAYGDYHHHVAANVWAGEGAVAPLAGTAGLLGFTLRTPGDETIRVPVARLA